MRKKVIQNTLHSAISAAVALRNRTVEYQKSKANQVNGRFRCESCIATAEPATNGCQECKALEREYVNTAFRMFGFI